MSRISLFLALWFADFRFGEFMGALSGAAGLGLGLAIKLGLPPDQATYIAAALAFIAAICYIRNPKYATWATSRSAGDGPDADVERDPLDESRDKDGGAH